MKTFIFITLLLVLSLFSISSFFQAGFFSIHDDTQIARTSEMMHALQDGMFPVRWVENLGYGYGYPIFNYYAPLPYYVGAFVGMVGIDALIATKISFTFATLFAGFTMFIFLKGFFGRVPALVGALVYLYFPYHAVNIFIRGNLNEVFAYAFLPLIFLGFYKLYYLQKYTRETVVRWVLLMGVGIALIVTSHNLSAYMMLLILSLLTGFALIRYPRRRINFLLTLFVAGIVGIGFSAFYWLPVLLEMKYSDVLSQVGGGADYRDHFVCLSQYWNSPWGFGGSGPGCIDGMSFKLGKINILITIAAIAAYSIVLLTKKVKEYRFLFFSTVGILFFAIFITSEYSSFLWEAIPRMDILQFPWRFINFSAIAISVLSAILIYSTTRYFGKSLATLAGVGVIVISIFMHAKLFIPQTHFVRNEDYYTNEAFIRWETSKISDEYMPQGFAVPDSKNEVPLEKVIVSTGSAVIENVMAKTGKVSATLKADSQSDILLTIAPFPAWKVFVNGKEVTYTNTNRGIMIRIPQGISTVEAKFIQTPIEKTGNVISLLTILGAVSAYIAIKKYGKKTKK